MESPASAQSAPVALAVPSSDSGANAGLQADLLTFSANGVYGTSAVTCVTAQNPNGVIAIHPIPPKTIVSQIEQIALFYNPKSIKTGILYSSAIVEAVSPIISRLKPYCKIIVDPVMIGPQWKIL